MALYRFPGLGFPLVLLVAQFLDLLHVVAAVCREQSPHGIARQIGIGAPPEDGNSPALSVKLFIAASCFV